MPHSYPVFKGLQKPLEFLGIRGRFLMIAAATIGGAFLLFFIGQFFFGMGVSIGMALAVGGAGMVTIYVKQKTGLHSKKRDRGIYIYRSLYKLK